MDNREEHKGKKAEKGNEPLERFRGGTIPWKVSMDEAWKEVEEEIRLVGIAPHNRAVFDTLWKPVQSEFTQRADELIKQSLSTQNIVVPGR